MFSKQHRYYRVIEPENSLGWKGPLRSLSSNPLLSAGTPPSRPDCLKFHPLALSVSREGASTTSLGINLVYGIETSFSLQWQLKTFCSCKVPSECTKATLLLCSIFCYRDLRWGQNLTTVAVMWWMPSFSNFSVFWVDLIIFAYFPEWWSVEMTWWTKACAIDAFTVAAERGRKMRYLSVWECFNYQ